MARSYRNSPFRGNTTAASEKSDKQCANRNLRAAVRSLSSFDFDADVIPVLREVSNVFTFKKDGKHRIKDAKLMRK